MSEAAPEDENVVVLRQATEAYNSGDLGFAAEHAADDIEVFAHHELLNSGTRHGRDGFRRWMTDWQEAWSEITLDIRDVEIVGGTYLLVDVYQRGIGAASGVPVEMDVFQLIEVRDGQIARFHLYPDRERAIAALEKMKAVAGGST